MESLYQFPFKETVQSINQHLHDEHAQLVTGLDGSARSVLLAQLFQADSKQFIIVVPIATALNQMYEDLQNMLPDTPVLVFPAEESPAIEFSVSSFDNQAKRIEVLETLDSGQPCIVLTSVAGIRKRVTSFQTWRQEVVELTLGAEIERNLLEQKLNLFGYKRQTMVQSPGEYSVRGSIVDFYPLDLENPVRLDFFDVELDSIRMFDSETQQSLENIDKLTLKPIKDLIFPLNEQQSLSHELKKLLDKQLKKIQDEEIRLNVERGMKEQLELLDQSEPLKYPDAYVSLLKYKDHSIIDYAQGSLNLIMLEFDKIQQQERLLADEDQFWIEHETSIGTLMPGMELRHRAVELIRSIAVPKIYLSTIQRGFAYVTFSQLYHFQYRSMNQFFNQLPLVKTEVDHWLRQEKMIQVVVNSHQRAIKVQQLFEENQILPVNIQAGKEPLDTHINLVVGQLASGFELPLEKWVVLTEKELFNQIKRKVPKQQKLTNAERIKSYSELEVGDYVVHNNHGIGKYTGMETMEINGVHRDLLAVEYQDNSRLLIPIDQIHLIQKYVTSEAKTPKLNKLGGTEWAKTKRKVASKIEDIADELIELYAKRESEKGYAFSEDTPEQIEFENAFEYVETDDQLKSTAEIKKDMERARPMDRLLVGDVGYGKTEVAMRAVFKAVMDGKQVAFLVPTTILAQQHYNTIVQRFAEYPFEIGLLSRFVSRARQNETIKNLESGFCNIVVGTHRLLSKDVVFQDLGLLVVDEEQRFGVKHKERLKQLKQSVDVLTLTATPIPRTLHMSMIGVRDLSVIETPPNNRYPVQTYVLERNEVAVKSAIERELARGGQVFYLYNRVATIDQRAMEISDLVPEARVGVAHGQMNELELETVLMDFIQGNYDVLVTTTIIETGVDIPNANTLFIDNADHMGLSTLYQLRGRVGRTHRIAFAYLMYEPNKQLSEVSEKRLKSIREFTELGSGFKIAMRDLSIRGAGNLLGKQQSGFIDSVGFDLYSQMLKEAVDIKRGNKHVDKVTKGHQLEWDVAFDAYLPSFYIEDERQKIALYKSIQNIDSIESYRDLQDQLIDRFGEFPDEVANLLEVALIRHFGQEAGIMHIKQQGVWLNVTFTPEASSFFVGPNIYEALQNVPTKVKVNYDNDVLSVKLLIQGKAVDQWLSDLNKFAQQADAIINKTVENEVIS